MSDTPPDRKEAGDAPAGPRNPWVGWLVWVILVPLLYVLSFGPVCWLVEKGYLPREAYSIHAPLSYLPDAVTSRIELYLDWWVPRLPIKDAPISPPP